MVLVPYIYRPSHILKQVIGQYGILVMFSAQQKISQVYARVHAGAEKRLQAKCTQKKTVCPKHRVSSTGYPCRVGDLLSARHERV